ncbi:hypothetical protein [Streptomyces sp. P3]|uniref:hypothetical protein n=1 Tax=unclassified Streptomyces TaxID=2593676 RepID=UPI001C1F72F1|nr:hypothetical protein [Streptomyces sp. P3]
MLAVLAFAVVRPRGWAEAAGAVPVATLAMAVGPVLVPDQLCADEGLFETAGTTVARRCGSGGAAR